MGYRSDVRAVVYGNNRDADKYSTLKLLMGTTFAPVVEQWGAGILTWHDSSCVLEFSIDDVKWYASYPQVDAFTTMLAELAELEYNTEFVRIGEDDDDTEINRDGDHIEHMLCINRVISSDI